MRAALALVIAWAFATCSPLGGRIRRDHAREFGCQERWVEVRDEDNGRFVATGCGFRSEWACPDGQCQMRDHRSYGVDSP